MALSIFYFYKLVEKIIYQVLCLYNNCFRVFSQCFMQTVLQ